MMKTFDEMMNEFNPEQKEAIKANKNTVVSAGAGSGKTKTLSARYVRLIVEDKMKVEEILTLTFTKKAAIEMYGRIYSELQKLEDNPYAKKAIDNFQKARISTLDSFCNSILRYSCRDYGLSPDFSIDEAKSKKIAENVATSFFLKKIKEPCLKEFAHKKNINAIISELFISLLSNYVTIAKPLDLMGMLGKQKQFLTKEFDKAFIKMQESIEGIRVLENSTSKTVIKAKEIVNDLPNEMPKDILDAKNEKSQELFNTYYLLSKARVPTGKDEVAILCRAYIEEYRIEFAKFLNICNYDFALMKDAFCLLDELQKEYINAKIAQGVLTYSDVANLALESLKNDVDLRNYYKKSIKTIMIDEFQDNNQLQRDILFLLAEKKERKGKTIPPPFELEEGKLFFVGDEKQSIYAFRGADVSVFSSLIKDLKNEIKLNKNYRTEKSLINIFNAIFPYIFYSDKNKPSEEMPLYEATFEDINYFQENKELNSGMEVLYVDSANLKNLEGSYLNETDCEAFFLAKRIKTLYDAHIKVRDKSTGKPRNCTWADFAILLRSLTEQGTYERYLKMFGIPYTASSPRSIFNYAPLNDLYAMLRLATYQDDDFCYAQVLKTPLVNISDVGFAQVMLAKKEAFSKELDEVLNEDDLASFKRGREIFENMQEALKIKSNAELITTLILEYRYLLLSNSSYHHFIELYDYLFYLAAKADQSSIPHFEFIDQLQNYIADSKNIEEMDIPVNQKKDSIKIMSVHKSKGLEFPIVVIPHAENEGKDFAKEGKVFYSNEIGLSLHTPDNFSQYRTSTDTKTNFFFEMLREEEKKKSSSELKRLFYVAMTRAEVKLILSCCFNSKNATSDYNEVFDQNNKEICNRTLDEFIACAPLPKDEARSFLGLFLKALNMAKQYENNLEALNLSFFEIPFIEKKDLLKTRHAKDKTIKEHIAYYEKLKVKEFPKNDEEETTSAKGSIDGKEDKNFLFDQNEKPIQIGEIAHGMLEAELNNVKFDISIFDLEEDEKKALEQYKNNFLSSSLGKMALASKDRKTEYGFITKYQGKEDSEPKLTRGVIDLFFRYENVVYIVDYKTDKKIEKGRYERQLSVYKKAVQDLWQHKYPDEKVEFKTFLFYLHLDKAIECFC